MTVTTFIIFTFIEVLLLALLLLVAYFCINGILTVPWVRTRRQLVDVMFDMAKVKKGETIVDFGSGDGSIVIEMTEMGAIGIGIERLKPLVWLSRFKAKRKGLSNKARFIQGDIFKTKPPEADVIFLYLFTEFNARLEPIFLKHYPSGTRIVSRDFTFPNLPLIKTKNVKGTKLHFYKIP